jgi:hypothetical protein
MNNTILIFLILTIVVILLLVLFAFGSRLKGESTKFNPSALKTSDSLMVSVDDSLMSYAIYHNKDKRENFYTVRFPSTWKITSSKPGEYDISYQGATGYLKLMDIPDDTNLQLYILSQIEPKLKKELRGYKRIDYRDIVVNGTEGFQFEYEYSVGKERWSTFTDYISGVDNACTISFTSKHSMFPKQITNFKKVIYTFRWEQK